MANLKDTANDFVPTTATQNITDLPEVSVDVELHDDSFSFTDKSTGEEKTVEQKVIKVGEEKYRVPVSVIQQLKAQLEGNQDMKKFKVTSTGSGMDTKYTVIPLI